MTAHDFAFPWSANTLTKQTISDANGVPVAVTLNYTSIQRQDEDGTVYNTSEYAGPIRTEYIVRAVNSHAQLIEALEDALFCMEGWSKIHDPEWDGKAAAFSAIGKARDALAQARESTP